MFGLAVITAIAFTATAAAAMRSCGAITVKGQRVSVTIARGTVSCAQARGVARSYVSGHGTLHGSPSGPRADMYVTLPGGWRCSVVEQGGAACKGGGSSHGSARNLVEFVWAP
jgi:hypothetical protein